MKTNHGSLINRRVKDNYGDMLKKMSQAEKDWAEKFERLEYAIERGFAPEAMRIATELNPNVTQDALDRIKIDVTVKERCNPVKAESKQASRAKSRATDQRRSGNMYDASDWTRTGGTIKDDDGEETERGITLNPEDALIEMLDAAKSHKVSIEEFLRNPKYHTQERKVGRPKKLESV